MLSPGNALKHRYNSYLIKLGLLVNSYIIPFMNYTCLANI